MKLVTASADMVFQGRVDVKAGTRVVCSDIGAYTVTQELRRRDLAPPRISGIGDYVRHYCGQDLAGKSLLAWRGCGIGDQLVMAGLLVILRRRFPTADLAFLTTPNLYPMWTDDYTAPFTVYHEPLQFAVWRDFDYHLLGEDMCEADREPDQPSVWDGHLALAGLRDVPAAERRPLVPVADSDRADAAEWLAARGLAGRRPRIVVQVAASTPIRSVQPDVCAAHLAALAAAFPAGAVIAVGQGAPYERACLPEPCPPNVLSGFDLALRSVFAMVETADLVVCPDSALGHVAGGLERPCISLWASFSPVDRVADYATHRPIWHPVSCSPCRVHERGPIPRGCPRPESGGGPYCRGLAGITPQAVVEQAKEILQ